MSFEGGSNDRGWVSGALWGLSAAALVAFTLDLWRIFGGVTSTVPYPFYFLVLMVPLFALFVVDVGWLKPDRIRLHGVGASAWERTRSVVWGVSAAAMLIVVMSPAIILFYAWIRPRLVAGVRAAIGGHALSKQGGRVGQTMMFVLFVVGWWVLVIGILAWASMSRLRFGG